jgi:hypothetical protein
VTSARRSPAIDALQELVEAVAQELQRSVAVDDASLRLLASSAHFEDVDPARLGSLVGRSVSHEVRDYVLRAGVQNWRTPTVLRAKPELGLERDRLCFPLRSTFELFGFMWLLDDGTVEESEIAVAHETAERIQELLALRAQSEADADLEMETVVLALLGPDPASRVRAAEDLRAMGLFARAESFSVVKVRTAHGSLEAEAAVRDVVRRGMGAATAGQLRGQCAYAVGAEQSVLVVGHRSEPTSTQRASIGRTIHQEMLRFGPETAADSTIGTSRPISRLSQVFEALDQASTACDVAASTGEACVLWDQHPLESLLHSWLRPGLDTHLVPEALRRLMEQPSDVIAVVEAFLDDGGNVSSVAETMHLHRTTVYYRLNRLKETTGIDLNDGATRLLVHLWLKGRHVADPGRSPDPTF